MNEQEQRIAIAEACGWSGPNNPRTREQVATWTKPEIWMNSPYGELGFITDCPDYLNDLNAMREAEKVLTAKQWDDYGVELECTPYVIQNWIHATAAKRAEAFLKTLNLWK